MNESFPAENPSLVLIGAIVVGPSSYSLERAAELAGVHPEMLRYYCRLGLFREKHTTAEHNPVFDDDAVYELRRFESYRRAHGLDRPTLRLICGLKREVDRLQAELRFLRER